MSKEAKLSKTSWEVTRNCDLRILYGISLKDYMRMYEKQHGRCAICEKECPPRGREGLQVDHCHETKQVRKLICGDCNRRLAVLDNADWMLKATLYLREFHVIQLQRSTLASRYIPQTLATSGRLYRQIRSRFWWMSFWVEGKRYRESARTEDEALAKERLRIRMGGGVFETTRVEVETPRGFRLSA